MKHQREKFHVFVMKKFSIWRQEFLTTDQHTTCSRNFPAKHKQEVSFCCDVRLSTNCLSILDSVWRLIIGSRTSLFTLHLKLLSIRLVSKFIIFVRNGAFISIGPTIRHCHTKIWTESFFFMFPAYSLLFWSNSFSDSFRDNFESYHDTFLTVPHDLN